MGRFGTFVKLTLLTGFVSLVFIGASKAKTVINGFDFKVTGYGVPTLKGTNVTVPVKISFTNSTPLSIPIDNIAVNVAYKQGSQFIHAATLNQSNLIIESGTKEIILYPVIDIKALFSNVLTTLLTTLQNKAITVRADVTLTVKGIVFPTYTVPDQDIKIGSGLGEVATGKRAVTPVPPHLLALVPKPEGGNEVIKPYNADPTKDTVPLMRKLMKRQSWQGKKLAESLKGSTVEETVRNDWDFMYKHIQYVKDPSGRETVRSLRRLVHEGKGDCDCFVNALGNLLINQGIKAKIRTASYDHSGVPSHVYLVVPNGSNGYLTLDPVVHQFNYEVPFTSKQDVAI